MAARVQGLNCIEVTLGTERSEAADVGAPVITCLCFFPPLLLYRTPLSCVLITTSCSTAKILQAATQDENNTSDPVTLLPAFPALLPFTFPFLYTSHLGQRLPIPSRYHAGTVRPHLILFLHVLTSSVFHPLHWHPEVASSIQNVLYADVFKTAPCLLRPLRGESNLVPKFF